MNEHGIEGFLILFFTNYFYEVTINQIKSLLKNEDVKQDPGYMFYKYKDKIGSYEEISNFENEIRSECNNLAKKVVKKIKNKRDLDKINTMNEKEFNNFFHSVIENLHEEVDIEK